MQQFIDIIMILCLQAVLVPTAEIIRVRYFMDMLMKDKHPFMLVGTAGTGKTVMINEKLQALVSREL